MKTHDCLKPNICDICNKSFMRKSDLKKHMRIHSGEKPYSYDICGRTFSISGNLSRHLKRHKGIQEHSCIMYVQGVLQSKVI